jgi:thiol-disulfide isomerase/thioredoxin
VPDTSKIVEKDSFERAPKVNIPGPPQPTIPPLPPGYPEPKAAPAPEPQRTPSPGISPTSLAPGDNVPVPSCQLVGRKLIDLALFDEKGNVWQYRTSRASQGRIGRLTLIDFWSSHCGPCLAAMPHLVELSQQYGPYGLDVVGIAYESGTKEQQISQVRAIRGRYGIRYPTLLGAGNNCPVRTQFAVDVYPTVLLLDESGEIVYRTRDGLGQRDYYELVHEIRRRLLNTQ